jgi:hypothetical protein
MAVILHFEVDPRKVRLRDPDPVHLQVEGSLSAGGQGDDESVERGDR